MLLQPHKNAASSAGVTWLTSAVVQSHDMQHGFSGGEQHNPIFTDPVDDDMLGLWLPKTQRQEPLKEARYRPEPLFLSYEI